VARAGVDARLFGELTSRRVVEIFMLADEPAWQRPTIPMRVGTTPDEEHRELPLTHGEQHDVDRDGNRRERSRVVPPEESRLVVVARLYRGHMSTMTHSDLCSNSE
jgi:hypothetical protein